MNATSNRLSVLAAEINAAHEAARRAARTTLEHAISAGERLLEAKAAVRHGDWLTWLAENVTFSDRTAQVYMKLAKHKGVIDTKSATAADLTVAGAVAEITVPKASNTPSGMARAARYLPYVGHVVVVCRESTAGWDEVWIAPSFQHVGFLYVTHIWTPRRGPTSAVGTRRPIRADMVTHFVELHMSLDMKAARRLDFPSAPWTYNLLLFDTPEKFVDSYTKDEIAEVADIAADRPPGDVPSFARTAMRHDDAPRPLFEMVFGETATDAGS